MMLVVCSAVLCDGGEKSCLLVCASPGLKHLPVGSASCNDQCFSLREN